MDVRKSKMKNPPFPILFAADAAYAPHLAAAICSLLQNNNNFQARIIVFTATLPEKDRVKLRQVCSRFNTPLEFINLDDKWFDELPLNHHFKKSNYYRLFAADLVEDHKCLYLDADLIVNGPISRIINTELNDSYLAAVEDPGFNRHKELGMKPDSKYFNSGVMLINLKKWREDNIRESVLSLIKRRPEAIHFVDQCGLNGVIDGRWLELGPEFNCQTSMLSGPEHSKCSNKITPIIVHFTGSSKPWHLNNSHPYKKVYWAYRNKTPYKALLPDDFGLETLTRYVVPDSFKTVIKRAIQLFRK